MHLILLYHFFHPDDVISAQHFAQLAEGLSERGWRVTAYPANRVCREAGRKLPRRESWQGIAIKRVWRPAWDQASHGGRLLNTLWMLGAWGWLALTSPRREGEVVVVGSDPVLGVLAALPWKWFRRRTRVVHWCFDLYPEAAVAEGLLSEDGFVTRLIKRLTAAAYRKCDQVADLGSCMAERLRRQVPELRTTTLTPWALVEPTSLPEANPAVRRALFGEARLALLYSGSFGRAHSYEEFLLLARRLRESGVVFCFAGRGNRAEQLRGAVGDDDTNIRFAGFAPQEELEQRLTACDVHLVSLRPEWTGTVVPSKFFGALAVGRAVLFAGSPESAIARWIVEHQVGWVLTTGNLDEVALALGKLAECKEQQQSLRSRCQEVYQQHFSREQVIDRWNEELKGLGAREWGNEGMRE